MIPESHGQNQAIQRKQGSDRQKCTSSSWNVNIRGLQTCLFWNPAFEWFSLVSSGHFITHWEHGKGMIPPRGGLAMVFRGSNNSDIFLPFLVPQLLMDPSDAVKSTIYLILGQEQQPEWKVSWEPTVWRQSALKPQGFLPYAHLGPACKLLWSELLVLGWEV